jgi:hypothetical protein
LSNLKIFSSVVIEFLRWHDAGHMSIIPLNEHHDSLINYIEQQILTQRNVPDDLPIFCYSEFNEDSCHFFRRMKCNVGIYLSENNGDEIAIFQLMRRTDKPINFKTLSVKVFSYYKDGLIDWCTFNNLLKEFSSIVSQE